MGVGDSLRDKSLGIYGYGRIGAVVAGYGRAFGMRVLVWAREESLARARADGHESAESKGIVLRGVRCVVASHAPRTGDARHCHRRRPRPHEAHVAVVNTSRAALIERGALVSALQAGRPGMAAVDVFDEEPLRDP